MNANNASALTEGEYGPEMIRRASGLRAGWMVQTERRDNGLREWSVIKRVFQLGAAGVRWMDILTAEGEHLTIAPDLGATVRIPLADRPAPAAPSCTRRPARPAPKPVEVDDDQITLFD